MDKPTSVAYTLATLIATGERIRVWAAEPPLLPVTTRGRYTRFVRRLGDGRVVEVRVRELAAPPEAAPAAAQRVTETNRNEQKA